MVTAFAILAMFFCRIVFGRDNQVVVGYLPTFKNLWQKTDIIILASYRLDGDTVEVAGGRGPNSDQEAVWETFKTQLELWLAQHN